MSASARLARVAADLMEATAPRSRPDPDMTNASQIPICSGEPLAVDPVTSGRWRTQARRKASILAASRMLLAERGFGGFHIRTVAKRSGVTPPTIYNLIGSRDLLLRNAIDEAIDAKFRAAAHRASHEAANILLAYADISCRCITENPDYYRRILRSVMLERSADLRRALIGTAKAKFLAQLRDMCERAHLAIEPAGLDTTADILVRQNFSAATSWAEYGIDLPTLRRQMVFGAGLILMGIVTSERRDGIKVWMNRLADQPDLATAS
jgi:AcrR family transcriptional regulator